MTRLFRSHICRITSRRWFDHEAISQFIRNNKEIENSTVFQGNLYEYTVMRELSKKLKIDKLKKIGGANDGGVDLIGKWPLKIIFGRMNQTLNLENNEVPITNKCNGVTVKPLYHILTGKKPKDLSLNVLVQCKGFTSSKVSPKELRELVGTYTSRAKSFSRSKKTVMIMCSPNMLTKEGLNLINSVPIPLMYLRIDMIKQIKNEYDIDNSGKLFNYYENYYASLLLQNLGIGEWLKLKLYDKCANEITK